MGDSSLASFLKFTSVVDSSFWHKLCQLKLDEDKIEEKERRIRGFYLHPTLCSLFVDCSSFNEQFEYQLGKTNFSTLEYLCKQELKYNSQFLSASGHLLNFNTLAKFKECNKSGLIEKFGNVIRSDIESGKALTDTSLISTFLLITYVNLKNYEFIYWFAFPVNGAIELKLHRPPRQLHEEFSESQIDGLLKSHGELPDEGKGFFGVSKDGVSLKCITLEQYVKIQSVSKRTEEAYLCFLDPSSVEGTPGWPLRNFLFLMKYHCKTSDVKVICLRMGAPFKSSFILEGRIDGDISRNDWVGWERNKRDKYGPRLVNLKDDMDPVRLAEASADLNLKLMKWRLVPEINLEIIKAQRCLLLGAGTLGCAVARSLLGWGVRHITFVDNGTVSFSNPVRQSLFKHKDCDLGKGAKFKAPTAAEALREILPTVVSAGVVLDIPMPGHATASLENAVQLKTLIASHDAVFLLTDSRESRWLPTLIASQLSKVAITAALGYDTYLVMRHGIRTESDGKLGCYFCNDITAPGNSMEDRTLDQQCTVTRPGVSSIAGALAVELFVSILQHSQRGGGGAGEETLLGLLPHSVRGFLAQFSQILPATSSFSQCIACSSLVEKAYSENENDFLKNVFESTKYLEDLTGLTELHKMTDTLEDLELSDEETPKDMDDP